jgi:hypothetical protein
MGPEHPRAIFAGGTDRAQGGSSSPSTNTGALRARAAQHTPRRVERTEGPDPGAIVADLARRDGTVLRVAVKRWRDPNDASAAERPFVDVRLWSGAWPVKGKGVSVKPTELAALATALLDAADQLASDRGGAPR